MTKLTIGRMAKLYGLHRSTLYEAIAKSRINPGRDGKGQRVIDLSEMIRVYGEPTGHPTPLPDTSTPANDSRPTPSKTPLTDDTGELAKLIEAAVERATAPLVKQIVELRATMLRIEHKPDTPAASAISPADPPKVIASFADLLAGLGE